jgi:hypothetical protein
MAEVDPPSPVTDPLPPMAPELHSTAPASDPSKTKLAVWFPIVISASIALGGLVGWLYSLHASSVKEREEVSATRLKDAKEVVKTKADNNERLLSTYLLPIQLKLKLSLSIYRQLSDQYLVPGYGILESYVGMARDQGQDKVALQYALITDLVGIDSQIEGLLEGYDPSHLTPAFKSESDKFLEHAHTYLVRFKALPSVIAAGGELPRWKPFPAGLPSALEDEIAMRQERPADSSKKVTFTEPANASAAANSGQFNTVVRSGWIGGGTNQNDWCNRAVEMTQVDYPGALISVVSSTENSKANNMPNHVEYQYSCELQVKRQKN